VATTEQVKLEHYLGRLDKALSPIAISERAEIITEIKSHILEATSNEQSLDEIMTSMGEPEQVANRYLMEKGLKIQKPPRHPIIKWLVIGFLGTFGLASLTIIFLVWKFSPIIKVDEEKGRVVILGGLIDIDESQGKVKFGSSTMINQRSESHFEGSRSLTPSEKKFVLNFQNGNITLNSEKTEKLTWKCDTEGGVNTPASEVNSNTSGQLLLNLEEFKKIDCVFSVPKTLALNISGQNGKIKFNEIESQTTAQLINGDISFLPNPNTKYKFDLKLNRGIMDEFINSEDEGALLISLKLENGRILKK